MLPDVVLFSGVDTAFQQGLWETNGTAGGTFELTGISGASASGISPTDLTTYNGEALFEGTDSSGIFGLWKTNGTVAGTQELTGISGALPAGIDPSFMTIYGGAVLFVGNDLSGNIGLWTTTGTAAGTTELTGISGAQTAANGGITPTDLTTFKGEVLFAGIDSSGNTGLWETNGTAAGTTELTGIGGANASGIKPSDMTVYGGEVLFQGQDFEPESSVRIVGDRRHGPRDKGTDRHPRSGDWRNGTIPD